jgi:hypothetical protein
MGIFRINAAEQGWRESWEPAFPLVAPIADMPSERAGGRADAWERAARHLEFMVRLMYWEVNAPARRVEFCAVAQMRERIERVERFALRAINDITQIPDRRTSRSLYKSPDNHHEGSIQDPTGSPG